MAIMHPKAAPHAGLGLASHDALGVTDFHGGTQQNHSPIGVFLLPYLCDCCVHRAIWRIESIAMTLNAGMFESCL